MNKTKILIVEDENTIAKAIHNSLVTLGYEVCAIVSSGESAIKSSQDFSPDLILMDIKLKGSMDGIEATQIIQSRFNIPVIYLTAYGDSDTIEKVITTAPYGYIYKPHDERELNGAIQTAIHKHIMDKKLKEKEAWLFTTLKSFGDAVITTDKNGYITFVNPVTEKLTNWKWEEAIGKPLNEVFNVKHKKTFENFDYFLNKVLYEGKTFNLDENFNLINKKNESIPIDDNCAPIKDEQGNILGAVIVFRDITQQKKSQQMLMESEEKYRLLSENALDGIYIIGPSGFEYANPAFANLVGYEQNQLYDKQFDFLKIVHPEDRKIIINIKSARKQGKNVVPTFSFRILTKNKQIKFIEVNTVPLLGDKLKILGITRDITASKYAEEKLKASLAEKEVLLKEINHRVKNNLQRILSLLRLQSKNVKDDNILRILQDSQHRVLSMALIHEQLYQSDNISEINFSEYVDSLVKKLYKAYNVYLLKIGLELKLDKIILDVDKAISCGLIINELVTNSFKHAFPENFSDKKKLAISLMKDSDANIKIIVSDNGIGIPKNIDIRKTKTLGLELVMTLLEQHLRGKLRIERCPGTKFIINFKA